MRALSLTCSLAVIAAGACLSPTYTDMTRCGPANECPSGRQCSGGFCLALGAAGGDGGVEDEPDAGARCPKATNFALELHGDQLARIPDRSSLRPQDITIEVWVKFTGFPGTHQVIVAKPFGAEKANSYAIWYQGDRLNAGINPTSFEDAIGHPFTPELGRWMHIAYTFDHASLAQKLYVDGTEVARGTAAAAPMYDSHPVLIGADSDNGVLQGFFEGGIDELWMWDAVRDAGEIRRDLEDCRPRPVAGLNAYLSFDEGEGQTAADGSGRGNDAALGEAGGADSRDPTWTESSVPFAAP
jgi:hypothetical protein